MSTTDPLAALWPIITQVGYPGAGDIDDCAIVATFWAARAAGYTGSLPTVAEFRAAAGVPDKPGPTGLLNTQVWRGVQGTVLATLHPIMRAMQPWDVFADALKRGEIASVALDSSKLPSSLRYGFLGAHRVGLAWRNRWLLANPLGPDQSAPLPIAEDTLKAAILANGGGFVYAVTFPPLEDSMLAVVTRTPFAAPRHWTVGPGVALRGFDPARPGAPVKSSVFTSATGGWATARVDVAWPGVDKPPVPNGSPFLEVSAGPAWAGLLVLEAAVTLDPEPEPKRTKVTVSVDDGRPPIVLEV